MKIGILTLPLKTNYGGGLLQAFALQEYLKKNGHDVYIINRYSKRNQFMILMSFLKRITKRVVLNKKTVIWFPKKHKRIIYYNTLEFINKYLNMTEDIDSSKKISLLEKYNFNAYIVGSDQVWRPDYSPYIANCFFDFLGDSTCIKRVAYAASFGTDSWKFSSLETSKFKVLANKFNSVSVREDSGVFLCKQHFDIDPIHVLDPTLLLDKNFYVDFASDFPVSKGELLTCVLDNSSYKQDIINAVVNDLQLTQFSIMPEKTYNDVGFREIEKCVFPSLKEWIRGFVDAKFIITDSFHGTVFSILFNKPFISIGNKERGLSRFKSLLTMLGLEDRLILSTEQLSYDLIHTPIDYEKVNEILKVQRIKSFNFINESLGVK